MENLKKTTFTVYFFIKRQKLLKNGEAPICMRITTQGQNTEVSLKKSIIPSLWNTSKECSKGKSHSDKVVNFEKRTFYYNDSDNHCKKFVALLL